MDICPICFSNLETQIIFEEEEYGITEIERYVCVDPCWSQQFGKNKHFFSVSFEKEDNECFYSTVYVQLALSDLKTISIEQYRDLSYAKYNDGNYNGTYPMIDEFYSLQKFHPCETLNIINRILTLKSSVFS
jgi:hypothetical protein